MKSYFSLKPGATFFLGSSRTLVYHKEDVEFVYKVGIGANKFIYAHIYLLPASENSLLWERYTDFEKSHKTFCSFAEKAYLCSKI